MHGSASALARRILRALAVWTGEHPDWRRRVGLGRGDKFTSGLQQSD